MDSRPRQQRGATVRQAPVQQPVQPQTYAVDQGYAPKQRRSTDWNKIVAVVVGLLAVIGVLVWLKLSQPAAIVPRSDRYQAVFLDTGQVFFGKLKNTEGAYLKLEKAYSTKKTELPADATDEQKAAAEQNVSLAKVGVEVYGPENEMAIRAEQVLFWQDLASESKVAKAIDNDN